MSKKSIPFIDAQKEAERLVVAAESGSPQAYRSEHYKHVLDVKRLIPQINPKYVARIERHVFIREECFSDIKENGKHSIYGYAVRVHLLPEYCGSINTK